MKDFFAEVVMLREAKGFLFEILRAAQNDGILRIAQNDRIFRVAQNGVFFVLLFLALRGSHNF